MKKKLIRIANQIYTLEQKIQNGENVAESIDTMEEITKSLTVAEMLEINEYLESKLNKQ
jgi:hypothetical protein